MKFPEVRFIERYAGVFVLVGVVLLATGLYLPAFKGFIFPEVVLYGWEILFILLAYLLNWHTEFQWTMGHAYFTLLALGNVMITLGAIVYPFLFGRLLSIGLWACAIVSCIQATIAIPGLLGRFEISGGGLLVGHYVWFAGMVLVTLGLFGKWWRGRASPTSAIHP